MFKRTLLEMAGIVLEEEPRKILEPRRIEHREEKRKQADWNRITELIKQTGGKIDDLHLSKTRLTELPEGIISAEVLYLSYSSVQKLPNSLKEVEQVLAPESKLTVLPEDLNITNKLLIVDCKDLKKIPSYRNLKYLNFSYSGVEEIGEYPNCIIIQCTGSVFIEKAIQRAKSQGMDVKEYLKHKHDLPSYCKLIF